MGEVFRARDTKLGREVAIKVLPATFAADPDRLARFEREARLLASLNHPNIGAIYGVEETAGVMALVLELVEGQTLAEKLAGRRAEGPGLPMAETLAIARQMADALDAAHERAIVHRDLKPANIIITSDGVVKVLDFGLAKIEPGNAGLSGDRGLTHSPTVIGPTLQGVLLGTAPYMSPEQARGKPVDKRTDIWAFGCVLYEMLTGRRAFGGETTTDSVAAILEREPDWSALPPATPRAVRTLLRRCLEKDPKRRLRDIGDTGVELDDAAASDSSTATPGAAVRTQSWRAASAIVLATAIASGVATAAWLRARSSPVPHRPAQFMFAAPDGHTLDVSRPAPSPDGSRIAFVAIDASGTPSIWMRSLGAIAPQPIAGTQGVLSPIFWSPDGRWLGFFAEGRLKKVEAAGGPVLNIATIANSLGAAWGADNVIIVAPANRTVLHRVSAAGGTPEPITTLNTDRKENSHRWPRFLPDGRHFLFTARSDVKENTTIYVGSIDSREITSLGAAQSNADYAAPGYLLYAQEGTVMARRFDARTLSLSGEAFPVAANVIHTTPSASAFFDVSADGSVLAYEADVRLLATLTWFDRAGRTLGTVGPDKNYTEVRLSPDGRLAAVVIPDPDSGNRDIWLADVRSGALTRFTSTPANDWQVAWSRDGRVLAFASDRNGQSSCTNARSTAATTSSCSESRARVCFRRTGRPTAATCSSTSTAPPASPSCGRCRSTAIGSRSA